MVQSSWFIRKNKDKEDYIDALYGKNPNLFTLELHHGGVFIDTPEWQYVDGKVNYVDCVDGDQFSVIEINVIIQALGYTKGIPKWYHFKKPDSNLRNGLHALHNDDDVRFFITYVSKYKILEVYVETNETKVYAFRKNSSPSVPKPPPRKKLIRKRPTKNLFTPNIVETPMVVETEARQESRQDNVYVPILPDREGGQGSRQDNVPNDFQTQGVEPHVFNDEFFNEVFFSDIRVQTKVNEQVNVQEEEVNVNEQNHVNEQVNVQEEEVNVNESGAEENAEGEDGEDSDDSGEDSDFIMDDEHRINDVEVDMTDFRDNIDANVEWVPHRDEVPDTGIHVEPDVGVVNLDNIDSGSDSADDARTKALKRQAREQATNTTSKVLFQVGQVFGTKKEVKELVTQLGIETRRQLKIVKNDNIRFRVVCTGFIPVFTNVEHSEQVGPSEQVGESSSVGPNEQVGPSEQVGESSSVGPNEQVGPSIEAEKGIKFIKKGTKEHGSKESGQATCPWQLHVSKVAETETWMVKTYKEKHNCNQTRDIKRCTSEFLAKQIQEQLKPDSKINVSQLRDDLQQKFHIGVSKHKIYRAKEKAKERLMGDINHQYAILRDYLLELQEANPDTTIRLDFEPERNPDIDFRVFRRIYICLGSLKQGFKACGRDLLGLDGCFMKGMATGQCLTAVGIDPNNGIFPVAYGIVESENKQSWLWFLEQLGNDLDLNHMSNFTFISDRQKGIIPAIAQLFPCAEHRFCLKHIYDNMKLHWRGQIYKDFLWKCATATTVVEFNRHMEELKNVSQPAYDWLRQIPPRHWSRSHFSGRAHCDVLLNNMCETFNNQLVDGRDKPIILCLEFIREYLMKRNAKVAKLLDSSKGPLTPNATVMFDLIKKEAEKYKATWNAGTKFQVVGPWMDQCVVDVVDRTCSCRKWELTGMPCKHAVCAFYDMSNNGMQVQLPESYIHPVYWLETWKRMYSYTIGPTRGRSYWPRSNSLVRILPPKSKVSIGRPKKKRRRSQIEIQLVKEGKLTRAAVLTKCGTCKQDGHNKRTCPRVTRQAGSSQRDVGSSSRGGASSSRVGGSKKTAAKKSATKKTATN